MVIVYQRFFPKNAAHMISQAKLIGSNTVEVPEQTFECDALNAVMNFIFEFIPSLHIHDDSRHMNFMLLY